jgi:hypothetical protein
VPWRPDYATLAELKHFIGPGITGTAEDAELTLALSAASRAIDHATGRQFGVLSAVAIRYYAPSDGFTAAGRSVVLIDDLMSVAGLAIRVDGAGDGSYSTTLTGTDYQLYPWNAAADGRPWTALIGAGEGGTWPRRERALEVTAKWGWTAVPAEVKQACLLQASRLLMRKNSPFGVAGSPEMGSELRLLSKLDPDVAVLVSGVRRYWGAA